MSKFETTCKAIKKLVPAKIKWEHDGRFNAALAALDRETADSLIDDITSCFENRYDHKTYKKGSKQEKKLAKALFGLSKGQFLFTSTDEEITLYGAWWPWGDNSSVSLRVGFFTISDGMLEGEEQTIQLKSWFKFK